MLFQIKTPIQFDSPGEPLIPDQLQQSHQKQANLVCMTDLL